MKMKLCSKKKTVRILSIKIRKYIINSIVLREKIKAMKKLEDPMSDLRSLMAKYNI